VTHQRRCATLVNQQLTSEGLRWRGGHRGARSSRRSRWPWRCRQRGLAGAAPGEPM